MREGCGAGADVRGFPRVYRTLYMCVYNAHVVIESTPTKKKSESLFLKFVRERDGCGGGGPLGLSATCRTTFFSARKFSHDARVICRTEQVPHSSRQLCAVRVKFVMSSSPCCAL